MMLLSELAEKELIEMENGVRYGYLSETECIFDPKTGKILGFELIEPSRLPFQKKINDGNIYSLGRNTSHRGRPYFISKNNEYKKAL